jgi:3-hydroxyacyl-CoA dehydrogenase
VNEPTPGAAPPKIVEAGPSTPEVFDPGPAAHAYAHDPCEMLDYVGIDIAVHALEYFATFLFPGLQASVPFPGPTS